MLKGGKWVSNFETLGAITSHILTVPADKVWIWFGVGYIERDQNATCSITFRDENDKPSAGLYITTHAAGTSNLGFPYDLSLQTLKGLPFYFPPGWDIVFAWGAAQTTPEIMFLVLEIPL